MSLGHSKLGGMLHGERNQLAGCVKLLLLWVAASDGSVDDSELEFAATHFPGIDGTVKTSDLLEVLSGGDLDSIEMAIRTLAKESRELRAHFLDMAITMSMADREIAIVEHHILRFYADALYLGTAMLEKRFQAITGTPIAIPGDPSSPSWWERVDAGEDADSPEGQPVMRDLYFGLQIAPEATAEEVQAALEGHPERGDSAAILLDPARREVYDGTRATLKMIGRLRSRLGLDTGHSWFREYCPEFVPMGSSAVFKAPARPEPPKPSPTAAAKGSGKKGRTRRRRRRSGPQPMVLAIALAAALLVILAIYWFVLR